jgi:hypothetical protein
VCRIRAAQFGEPVFYALALIAKNQFSQTVDCWGESVKWAAVVVTLLLQVHPFQEYLAAHVVSRVPFFQDFPP